MSARTVYISLRDYLRKNGVLELLPPLPISSNASNLEQRTAEREPHEVSVRVLVGDVSAAMATLERATVGSTEWWDTARALQVQCRDLRYRAESIEAIDAMEHVASVVGVRVGHDASFSDGDAAPPRSVADALERIEASVAIIEQYIKRLVEAEEAE